MTDDSSTPVTSQPPPKAVLAVANRVFAGLLRSPLHGVVDSQFLLLHLTGRRTGIRYRIVVARHHLDGVLTVMTSAPWRLNTRGGAEVLVTSEGRTRRGHAVLVEDPDQVADGYAAEIDRIGWQGAQRTLGLKLPGRAPSLEELLEAVHRDHLCLIRIELRDHS